ncbi:MAG TPA: SET domain-containing protein-lysine N-methyltransferase [Steroidobacteraceae bacterium]|nr:SET domain-containing protein-lysine N-methyltransferase [Steroidobacteraceae bacterium]
MAAKKKAGRKAARKPPNKWLVVRRSKVHGNGCFARRFIPKGTRIIEYLGERMSHKEADRRYENEDVGNNHTFLFIADRRTVIDATVGGNEARWINHSCDGNCESEIEKGRVFIDARRDIQKGEELGYDYQIGRDKSDPPNVDEIYACRCGSPKCRGSMLWPPKRRKKAAARKRTTAARKPAPKTARKTRTGRKATRRAGASSARA